MNEEIEADLQGNFMCRLLEKFDVENMILFIMVLLSVAAIAWVYGLYILVHVHIIEHNMQTLGFF